VQRVGQGLRLGALDLLVRGLARLEAAQRLGFDVIVWFVWCVWWGARGGWLKVLKVVVVVCERVCGGVGNEEGTMVFVCFVSTGVENRAKQASTIRTQTCTFASSVAVSASGVRGATAKLATCAQLNGLRHDGHATTMLTCVARQLSAWNLLFLVLWFWFC
jgi:hypothetical protein